MEQAQAQQAPRCELEVLKPTLLYLSSMTLHCPHPRPLSPGRGERQPQTRNLPFYSPSPKLTADATLREGGRG